MTNAKGKLLSYIKVYPTDNNDSLDKLYTVFVTLSHILNILLAIFRFLSQIKRRVLVYTRSDNLIAPKKKKM